MEFRSKLLYKINVKKGFTFRPTLDSYVIKCFFTVYTEIKTNSSKFGVNKHLGQIYECFCGFKVNNIHLESDKRNLTIAKQKNYINFLLWLFVLLI